MLRSAIRGGLSFEDIILYIISALIVVFLTLPIHEWAHAFTAYKLGDKSVKYSGRLTLNPFAHIDYMGALMIILFGFGWAKPVPVNMNYFKKPKQYMAITALAGPLANLVMAFLAFVLRNIVILLFPSAQFLKFILYYVAQINISLAVFNLIPLPPLDGSRILTAFLSDRVYYKIMAYERYLILAVYLLIITNALTVPLNLLCGIVLRGVSYLAYLPFSFFLG